MVSCPGEMSSILYTRGKYCYIFHAKPLLRMYKLVFSLPLVKFVLAQHVKECFECILKAVNVNFVQSHLNEGNMFSQKYPYIYKKKKNVASIWKDVICSSKL